MMRRVLLLLSVLWASAHAGCPFHGSSQAVARVGSGSDEWHGQIPAASNASDPFVKANELFLTSYHEGDYFVLHYGGTVLTEAVIPPRYHNLKMVSHFVLCTYIITLPDLYGHPADTTLQLSLPTVGKLADLHSRLLAVKTNLAEDPSRFDAGDQLARQHFIVDNVIAMLGNLTASPTLTPRNMTTFVRSVMPAISLNLQDAAAAEVNTAYGVLEAWRAKLPTAAWDKLWLVNTPSHMARRAELLSQLFSRYFNVSIVESNRFIAIESNGAMSEATARTILNSHVTDYAAGDAFFDDHWRLHQDALCAGAKVALDKLFPDSANTTQGCISDPPNPSAP